MEIGKTEFSKITQYQGLHSSLRSNLDQRDGQQAEVRIF
jgi:hypothetical protein